MISAIQIHVNIFVFNFYELRLELVIAKLLSYLHILRTVYIIFICYNHFRLASVNNNMQFISSVCVKRVHRFMYLRKVKWKNLTKFFQANNPDAQVVLRFRFITICA